MKSQNDEDSYAIATSMDYTSDHVTNMDCTIDHVITFLLRT